MELHHRRRVDSSPAVANGVVYVGSDDDNVYALNASTGALLWSYTTGNDVYSSPAVANGVVYVGSDDGNVYALNANTGATAVELHHRQRCGFLARRGEWGGLCRLERRQCLRLRPAVESRVTRGGSETPGKCFGWLLFENYYLVPWRRLRRDLKYYATAGATAPGEITSRGRCAIQVA